MVLQLNGRTPFSRECSRAAGDRGRLGEELPEACKDVDAVVGVREMAGLARRAARLEPLGIIKG